MSSSTNEARINRIAILRLIRWLSQTVRPASQILVGFFFEHMSFTLPVERLLETKTLLAFYHPRPSYPVHILLVPKKAIASLTEIGPQDQAFLGDLFTAVQSLVAELGLAGYRLIANGGEYQDIPQLHFHLVSDCQPPESNEAPRDAMP